MEDFIEEEVLISAVMYSINNRVELMERFTCDDFGVVEHQAIWNVFLGLWTKSQDWSMCEVFDILQKACPEAIPVIQKCMYLSVQYMDVKYYAEQLISKSRVRQLRTLSLNVHRDLADKKDSLEIAKKAMDDFAHLCVDDKSKKVRTGSQIRKAYGPNFERKQNIFIPTGFKSLDSVIGGFAAGKMYFIGARPAMGKTTLICKFINSILDRKIPVGFLSMEMSGEFLYEWLLQTRANLSSWDYEKGIFTAQQKQILTLADQNGVYDNIHIDDSPCPISSLRSKILRLSRMNGCKVIFVDHLGKIKSNKKDAFHQTTEAAEEITSLAHELGISIVCLSQLSRKVAERPGHIPVLSDFMNSTSVEGEADVAIAIHRRDYYDSNDHPGETQIMVLKNRVTHKLAILNYSYHQGEYSERDSVKEIKQSSAFGGNNDVQKAPWT